MGDEKLPDLELTFTEYFDYVRHEPVLPVAVGGTEARRPVIIAGGGPTGLGVALGLARYGVPSVVLEADDAVCSGSRAGAITRRTLEIFEQLGIIEPALAKGFAWSSGRTFYRDHEVFSFEMPHDANQKLPAGMSLQQNYVEHYLVQEAQRHADLIEIRWQSKLAQVSQDADGVDLVIETPLGQYSTSADWLVAADGGRSTVRRDLGLSLHGTSYEGRYVIIDIRIDTEGFPVGRRCWFDPPSNPGATLLMYTKPDNMVRFDYQLALDEDPVEAMRPEVVLPRVDKHLAMMGVDRPWEPVWMSLYRANAVTLDDYVHGRVVFAGEAAHLIPIFGVRGMNSSLDDAHNLAWKLALVQRGLADRGLLDSYSAERVYAARENIRFASKGAEFMAPPSEPFTLMRDAVLSLSAAHPRIASLMDPRQHSAIPLLDSPLNVPSGEGAGPMPGDILRECPLTIHDASGARSGHVTDLLGAHFTLFAFTAGPELAPALGQACRQLTGQPVLFEVRAITRGGPPAALVAAGAPLVAEDSTGRVFDLYDVAEGDAYLVRPDGHVLARWTGVDDEQLAAAVQSALAQTLAGGSSATTVRSA